MPKKKIATYQNKRKYLRSFGKLNEEQWYCISQLITRGESLGNLARLIKAISGRDELNQWDMEDIFEEIKKNR